MISKDFIETYLAQFSFLNTEDVLELMDAFKERLVKKRQFIVQPGFTARHKNFVAKGSFRTYVVTEDGHDHTITFAIENWWITDYNSYIFQQPATMFVIALEDSIILQIDYETEEHLKRTNHRIETLFRMLAERSLAAQQRRIISNLTQTAEQRYEQFISKYPQVVQKVPQYALASYLGMTTEFLSRIRNRKTTKKT